MQVLMFKSLSFKVHESILWSFNHLPVLKYKRSWNKNSQMMVEGLKETGLNLSACLCFSLYIYIYIFAFVCACICIYMCVCVCMCVVVNKVKVASSVGNRRLCCTFFFKVINSNKSFHISEDCKRDLFYWPVSLVILLTSVSVCFHFVDCFFESRLIVANLFSVH